MRPLSQAERVGLDFLAWRAWNKLTDPEVRRIVYRGLLPKEGKDHG